MKIANCRISGVGRVFSLSLDFARRAMAWALVVAIWLETSPLALAAKNKTEAEAEPTKSYVVPWLIVLTFMGLSLMAILRPSRRADKVDERLMRQAQQEE